MTPKDIFKKWAPSVVTVETDLGHGSGFVVGEGLVATNYHVIEGASRIRIKTKRGTLAKEVEIAEAAPDADLALLSFESTKPLKAVKLGNSKKVREGDRVVAIGSPLGLDHTMSDGIVSAVRIHDSREWIQISVPISPGSSGGPLFDTRGKVVGVTTACFVEGQNLNLAIPVNDLKALL